MDNADNMSRLIVLDHQRDKDTIGGHDQRTRSEDTIGWGPDGTKTQVHDTHPETSEQKSTGPATN